MVAPNLQSPPTPPSLEQLWAEVGFTPNPDQRRAIEAGDGPLYLTAGPGSGKTRVLLWRSLHLIVHRGVPPQRIFLGTFTEKGAHQLREGLRGLLSTVTARTGVPYDISQMAIGTIHSICHRLLLDRRFAEPGRRPRVPVVLDEFQQYQFVYRRANWARLTEESGLGAHANKQITEFFENRQSASRHRAVVNAIGFFNRCSEEALDPSSKRPRDRMVKAMLRMYSKYLELLAEDTDRPRTDLSRLQTDAWNRIQDDRALELFDHVIVDEYQDTNRIQEKIYFRLASRTKNLCVVGDDDQALYRFRGATVDNFLAFPDRCEELLGVEANHIPLVTNYRSRPEIVAFYNRFMKEIGWRRGRRTYRVDKEIDPARSDDEPAVFVAGPDEPLQVANDVADAVSRLIEEGRVNDPRDIAFLFPSLKSRAVTRMREALEERDLLVYAPRASTFIDIGEAKQVFGLFLEVFGMPDHRHEAYAQWMEEAHELGAELIEDDPQLARFIQDRCDDVERVLAAEEAMVAALDEAGRSEEDRYDDRARDLLAGAPGLPEEVTRFLRSPSLRAYVRHQRERRPDRPITNRYVINRASSLDWGLLDLFYQLTTFDAFKRAFDLAESGEDEGPICNLSLLSDYIARFQEQSSPVITAQFLKDDRYARYLFSSYLYSIFRLGQGEYEDKQDPFPKGRIPFLTVHQAKGLEFPVVVLGNLRKDDNGPRKVEQMMQALGHSGDEPVDAMNGFDIARMFYVALSRAKQALILCPYRGRGQRYNAEFAGPLEELAEDLSELDPGLIEPGDEDDERVPHPYSFTGDYVRYKICPRRYMIYRRYGFVPSRGQTTIFGNLVHRTIEDLHQWLIHQRNNA